MVRAVPDGSLPFCLAAVVAFEDRDFVVVQRIRLRGRHRLSALTQVPRELPGGGVAVLRDPVGRAPVP